MVWSCHKLVSFLSFFFVLVSAHSLYLDPWSSNWKVEGKCLTSYHRSKLACDKWASSNKWHIFWSVMHESNYPSWMIQMVGFDIDTDHACSVFNGGDPTTSHLTTRPLQTGRIHPSILSVWLEEIRYFFCLRGFEILQKCSGQHGILNTEIVETLKTVKS